MGMSRGQDPNWRRMFALMKSFPLTDDEWREWIGMLLGRPADNPLRSRKELNPGEVRLVIAGIEGFLLMSSHLRDIRGTRHMSEQETPE